MSDIKTKTIKNTSGVQQSVVYRGSQFILQPYDEATYDVVIADLFLEMCAPIVVDTTERIGDTYAPEFQRSTKWLANMTGDPDAPDEVEQTLVDKDTRRWRKLKVPNPNKAARTISRVKYGGQIQYTARDGGLVNQTAPAKTLEVPPFRRRALPIEEAEWFKNRDGLSSSPGAVIFSRPPSDFEPDMSWPLDRMRSYAQFLDQSAGARGVLGPSEEDLVARATGEGFSKVQLAEELRKAKQSLMRWLYFKLVNPDCRLPTRIEFEEWLTGKSAVEIEESEVEKLFEKADRQTKTAKETQSRAKGKADDKSAQV